jgi:hypothetical protein
MDSSTDGVLDTSGKHIHTMDHPESSQPPPSSSPTNPVVAIGRKVKSVLSTNQRPSVRLLRQPSSTQPRRAPVSQDFAEKPLPELPPHPDTQEAESLPDFSEHYATPAEASRVPSKGNASSNARNRAGSVARSLFRREDHVIDHKSYEDEYDADTVDLLDVMGMYAQPSLRASRLTLCRPRSSYLVHTHQCPKFALRPFAWRISQSPGYV